MASLNNTMSQARGHCACLLQIYLLYAEELLYSGHLGANETFQIRGVTLFLIIVVISLQGVALCIARLRNIHKQCPKEVVSFIMDLFKYSDNQTNKV